MDEGVATRYCFCIFNFDLAQEGELIDISINEFLKQLTNDYMFIAMGVC